MWWIKRDCIWENCKRKAIFRTATKRHGNKPLTQTALYCREHLIDRIKSWSRDASFGEVRITRVDKQGMVDRKGRVIA